MEHWPVLGSNRKFIEISDKLLLKEFVQPNGCGFGTLAIRRNYWPPTLMCLEQEKDSKVLQFENGKKHTLTVFGQKEAIQKPVVWVFVRNPEHPFFGPSNFSWTFSQLKKWTILCPGPKWRLVGLPKSPPVWGEMESGDFKVRRAVRGTRPAENCGVLRPQKPGFPYFLRLLRVLW